VPFKKKARLRGELAKVSGWGTRFRGGEASVPGQRKGQVPSPSRPSRPEGVLVHQTKVKEGRGETGQARREI